MLSRLSGRALRRTRPFTSYTSPGLLKGAEIVTDLSPFHLSEDPSSVIKPLPVFQQLNEQSQLVSGADFFPSLSDPEIVNIFDLMVKVNVMDGILQEIQRQGRISFYIANFGEEATQLGTVSALKKEDEIWTQYRELGCFLYRGLTVQMATDQTMSTKFEPGKGRQMPIHYTMIEGHVQSVTSPLGTKILHAAGAGYAFKLDKADRVGVVYFGEGAASEGDFAVGLNFAATLGAQTLFVCRNNGYAISTPTTDQYRGDGIAPRALAYGMKAVRVDGNDVVAVHNATRAAREQSINGGGPVLLELMTYRRGPHSTSDDSSKYRPKGELEEWSKAGKEPISRFKTLLLAKGLIKDGHEEKLREDLRAEVLDNLKKSEAKPKASIEHIFTDVYADMPWHLRAQLEGLEKHLETFGENYNLSLYDRKKCLVYRITYLRVGVGEYCSGTLCLRSRKKIEWDMFVYGRVSREAFPDLSRTWSRRSRCSSTRTWQFRCWCGCTWAHLEGNRVGHFHGTRIEPVADHSTGHNAQYPCTHRGSHDSLGRVLPDRPGGT